MTATPFSDHRPGRSVGIDGPGGARKTTIVQHLAQLLVAAGDTKRVTGAGFNIASEL